MATATENTGPAHLVDPLTGFPAPLIGQIENGHVLIAFTGKGAADNSSYAYGVGLFAAPAGDVHFHDYVVWSLILESTGRWVCQSGDYVQGLTAGVKAYQARGGKV